LLPLTNHSDRYPSAPVISEVKNTTVLENGTAIIECSILSDLGAHIEWIKHFRVVDKKAIIPHDAEKLEVSMSVKEKEIFVLSSVVGFSLSILV
jgi:hypothetical protein